MKDLGPLKYFLGIEVARNSSEMYLSQRKYVIDIITETRLLEAKLVTHPSHTLAKPLGASLSDPTRYHCLVGRLIYLVVTRLKLSYAIHVLSQFMNDPKTDHWEAATRVVHYGLVYSVR